MPVDAPAQCAGRVAGPAVRFHGGGQLRIVQHDALPVVQQQHPHREGLRGGGGRIQQFFHRAEIAREQAVLVRHLIEIPALSRQAGDRQAAGAGLVARRQHQGLVGDTQLFEDIVRGARFGLRVGEQARGHHAEPFPEQFAAQLAPLGQAIVAGARQRHQCPFAVPGARRPVIDALRGVRGVAQAVFRQQIQAAPSMALGLQPALRDQPEHAGA
ncbi:Uncharacterised protein [Bordetella pertussis]|nr:Uncharacterised protein [Bordetella pertussis]CFT96905.1 Uncharacterised protein [Bordetella pertussis]